MSLKNNLKSFRKSLAKKLFDRNVKSGNVLDIEKAGSILFLRNDDKIGDMVISTILFREIKKAYPEIKVLVLCGKNNKAVIKNNPNVDKIYEVSGNLLKDFSIYRKIRKEKIDIAVDFFQFRPRPSHLFMLRKIASGFLVGFHKDDYNIYDASLNSDLKNQHIVKVYEEVLSYFNVKNISFQYNVFLSAEEDSYGKSVCEKFKPGIIIFFNTYAAKKRKTFSKDKITSLTGLISKEYSNAQILLNTKDDIKNVLERSDNVFITDKSDLLKVAAIIKYSDIIITPDTSIVHIAAAFNKKTIALYLSDSEDEEKLNTVWAPNNANAVQMNVNTGNGALKNDIKNIDDALIIKELKYLMEKNLNNG